MDTIMKKFNWNMLQSNILEQTTFPISEFNCTRWERGVFVNCGRMDLNLWFDNEIEVYAFAEQYSNIHGHMPTIVFENRNSVVM